MTLTSHQPDLLPYMGFFYKVARSDVLVFSDDVWFSKKGMHNWNYIKTPAGAKKITVPVHARHDMPLSEVTVSEIQHSLVNLLKTIEQNYRKAPHWEEGQRLLEQIRRFVDWPRLSLSAFNMRLNLYIMGEFGITPKEVQTGTALCLTGHKDERIFQMCERLGADVYLSGRGAADYHQPEEYLLRGIDLVYTDYQAPEYPQLYGEFVPNLSVVDYIFNCGFELPRGWKR